MASNVLVVDNDHGKWVMWLVACDHVSNWYPVFLIACEL